MPDPHTCTTCQRQHDARPLRCECGGSEFVRVTVEQKEGAVRMGVEVVGQARGDRIAALIATGYFDVEDGVHLWGGNHSRLAPLRLPGCECCVYCTGICVTPESAGQCKWDCKCR